MKKRVLFLTMLLLAAMVFTSVLLADSSPTLHLVERGGGGGGCFETATVNGGPFPDNVPSGACWDIVLSNPPATVVDVSVDVAATHTWIGDLEFWLNSPDGSDLHMMDRPGYAGQAPGCCGDNSDLSAAAPLSFYDSAPTNAELMSAGGGIVCQSNGLCDYFPNPDGQAGSLPNFAGFAGENVDGTWQFCAADNAGGDTGSISTVTLNVTCNVPAIPGIAFTKTVGTDPNACAATDTIVVTTNSFVTYCYYMTNTGTVTAELHTVVDDQLGTVLGPDAANTVAPGNSFWFTVTTSINTTTVNSATWSTTDAAGGNGVSASDTATVTVNQPTSVSVSSFGNGQAAFSPVWLAGLFAILVAAGFILRRKWIRVD